MNYKIKQIIKDFANPREETLEKATNEIISVFNINNGDYIGFAIWLTTNHYRKLKYTHPNNVGKWWSDYDDLGYLTDDELVTTFFDTLTKVEDNTICACLLSRGINNTTNKCLGCDKLIKD